MLNGRCDTVYEASQPHLHPRSERSAAAGPAVSRQKRLYLYANPPKGIHDGRFSQCTGEEVSQQQHPLSSCYKKPAQKPLTTSKRMALAAPALGRVVTQPTITTHPANTCHPPTHPPLIQEPSTFKLWLPCSTAFRHEDGVQCNKQQPANQ